MAVGVPRSSSLRFGVTAGVRSGGSGLANKCECVAPLNEMVSHTYEPMSDRIGQGPMKEVLKTFEQSIDKYHASDNITVKLIIQVFCHTFKEQVAHRAYFYKNSRLVRTGIVRMDGSRYTRSQDGDLTGK